MTQRGVASRRGSGYDVTFERSIPHAPERVWAMLTHPEWIATWFCARVEIDPRMGGRMVEHHDHVGVDVFGEITRWEPPRVFEHTWRFDEERSAPAGVVTWELAAERPGTRLRLTHHRAALDEGGISGAHVSLDVLCAVLDGADPTLHAAPAGEFRDGEFVQTRVGRGRWADREELEAAYRRDFDALEHGT